MEHVIVAFVSGLIGAALNGLRHRRKNRKKAVDQRGRVIRSGMVHTWNTTNGRWEPL